MPFDEDEEKEYIPKIGVKQVQGQKSMFDNKPRQPNQQDFQQKVQNTQDRLSGHKKSVADLFLKFQKVVSDKTLAQNRNILNNETERELLKDMMRLAEEINNDQSEMNDMGSLTWVALLLKTCLYQRDRINELEYDISLLKKRMESSVLTDFIIKEVNKILDKKKDSE